MAVAFVRSQSAVGAKSISGANVGFTAVPVAGDLLICTMSCNGAVDMSGAHCVDPRGVTWSLLYNLNNAAGSVAVLAAVVPTPSPYLISDTVTCYLTASTSALQTAGALDISEYSGVSPTLDVAVAVALSSTAPGVNSNPATPGDMAIGIGVANNNAGNWNVPAGWTLDRNVASTGGSATSNTALLQTYQAEAGTSTVTFGLTGGTKSGNGILMLLKAASTSPQIVGASAASGTSSLAITRPVTQPTFVKAGGSASAKTGLGTTVTLTVPGGHAAGNLLVIASHVGYPGTNAWPTVTDSRGNSWSHGAGVVMQNTGEPSVVVLRSLLTTALQDGDTITISYGGTITVGYAVMSAEFEGVSVADLGSTFNNAFTSDAVVGPMTPSAAPALVLGIVGMNGPSGDAFTNDPSTSGGDAWHDLGTVGTSGGSASSNQTIHFAYKMATVAEVIFYDPATAARDFGALIQAYSSGTPYLTLSGSGAGSGALVLPTWISLNATQASGNGTHALTVTTYAQIVAATASASGTNLAIAFPVQLVLGAVATGVTAGSISAATGLALATLATGAASASVSAAMLLGLTGAGAVASPSAAVVVPTSVGFQQASGSASGSLSISTATVVGFQVAAAAGVGSLAVLVAQQLAMADAAVAVGALALTAPSWVSSDQASAVSGGTLAITAPGALALAASTAVGSGALVLRIRTLLRPNGDVLTGWTSDQATHFGALDDAVEQPTAPASSDLVFAANAGQIDRVAFEDAAISGTADGTLWVYAQATGLGVTIELYKGVTLVSSATLAAGTAAGWVPIAFSGLTQTEVNSLEMRLVT